MNTILFDDAEVHQSLKPLTLTRPVAELRIGILKIKEKWENYFGNTASFLTAPYLAKKYPIAHKELSLYLCSNILPTVVLAAKIQNLNEANKGIRQGEKVIAFASKSTLQWPLEVPKDIEWEEFEGELESIQQLPDLFLKNGSEIKKDFTQITRGRQSEKINDIPTYVYNPENVFLEAGVQIRACTINAENGPVYIGKNAIIQENSLIIGPACIGENAMVAFGAKIRNNTTLGPGTRVGGEVGNSIFFGNSNKAHDGFLGNSVIGEWCNLGANTNNSNLKNNYKNVALYSYESHSFKDTGEVFCGTFMGDYSKTGISTMLNTGTVIGVCCNVYGADFQEKFIPSFSWGGKASGYIPYIYKKAIDVINATMARRERSLSAHELDILAYLEQNKEPQV